MSGGMTIIGAIISVRLVLQGLPVMYSNDQENFPQLLAELREEHRDLDDAIKSLTKEPWVDQLRLRRMKKRKLKLKDWIAYLESHLIPDLDA